MVFEDREAVMDWMDANQLGRRNLTPDAFKLALGRRYNRLKKAANDGGKGTPKGTVDQNDPQSTAAKLAAEHSVSEATVKRAGKFAAEVAAKPELQKAIDERKPVLQVKREIKESNRESRRKENRAKVAKAAASKTNAGAVSRGDTLAKERPDLAEKVRMGEMKPAEARRRAKRRTSSFSTWNRCDGV
jgi:hypothetical protein